MYQPNTFRMSYDTKIVDIKTSAQRRLALAYLKRWAKQDQERREERLLLSTMATFEVCSYLGNE